MTYQRSGTRPRTQRKMRSVQPLLSMRGMVPDMSTFQSIQREDGKTRSKERIHQNGYNVEKLIGEVPEAIQP